MWKAYVILVAAPQTICSLCSGGLFCEQSMSVAAEKIASVVLEPVMDRIEDMRLRAERLGVEAEAETVAEIREGLAETWRIVEERGV